MARAYERGYFKGNRNNNDTCTSNQEGSLTQDVLKVGMAEDKSEKLACVNGRQNIDWGQLELMD